MSTRRKTLAVGIVLLLTAGIGTYVAVTASPGDEAPPCFRGGYVGTGDRPQFMVADVDYDASAHRVGFHVVFDAGEPIESIDGTIRVMQLDPSDSSISEADLDADGIVEGATGEVVWEVEDYALAPGLVFFGVGLKGRVVCTESGERPLDGSIGGFWQP